MIFSHTENVRTHCLGAHLSPCSLKNVCKVYWIQLRQRLKVFFGTPVKIPNLWIKHLFSFISNFPWLLSCCLAQPVLHPTPMSINSKRFDFLPTSKFRFFLPTSPHFVAPNPFSPWSRIHILECFKFLHAVMKLRPWSCEITLKSRMFAVKLSIWMQPGRVTLTSILLETKWGSKLSYYERAVFRWGTVPFGIEREHFVNYHRVYTASVVK